MLLLVMIVCLILYMGVNIVMSACGLNLMDTKVLLLSQAISQLLTFACPAVVWAALSSRRVGQGLHLRFQGRYWLLMLAGIIVFVLLTPLIDALTVWNDSWHLTGAWKPVEEMFREMTARSEALMSGFLQQSGVENLLLNLLVIALLPAVCEELFFRGALQTIVTRWVGNAHVAIALTALLFSLAHGDLFGLVPRWVMGMALGYLFYYGGSLLASMGAHLVNNAIIVVAYWLYYQGYEAFNPDEPLHLAWWMVVLCTVAAVLLFAVFFLLKHKKSVGKGQKNKRDEVVEVK